TKRQRRLNGSMISSNKKWVWFKPTEEAFFCHGAHGGLGGGIKKSPSVCSVGPSWEMRVPLPRKRDRPIVPYQDPHIPFSDLSYLDGAYGVLESRRRGKEKLVFLTA